MCLISDCITKLTVRLDVDKPEGVPIELDFTIKCVDANQNIVEKSVRIKFLAKPFKECSFIFKGKDCIKVKDICRVTLAHQIGMARTNKDIIINVSADICNGNKKVEKRILVDNQEVKQISTKPLELTIKEQ